MSANTAPLRTSQNLQQKSPPPTPNYLLEKFHSRSPPPSPSHSVLPTSRKRLQYPLHLLDSMKVVTVSKVRQQETYSALCRSQGPQLVP